MSAKFNVSDVVMLNSGGPAMTIDSFSAGPNCIWFDSNGNLHRSLFRESSLVKIDDLELLKLMKKPSSI